LRTILLVAFLLSPAITLHASQIRFFENGKGIQPGPDAGLFVDNEFRRRIDLSGAWKFTLDGEEWNTVAIPSAFDSPQRVTFQRTFALTGEMLDKYAFWFVAYGINYQSEIHINGTFIGRHAGGYTTVMFPIARNVLQLGSENVVTIACSNELDVRSTVPLRQRVGGWRSYGGILRDIYVLGTPRILISDAVANVESVERTGVRVRVRGIIESRENAEDPGDRPEGLAYVVEAFDKLNGSLIARSAAVPFSVEINKTQNVSADVILSNPRMWSPSSPDLYVLRSSLVQFVGKSTTLLDELDRTFGICETRFHEGKILVNGGSLSLKGVVWREDHPSFGGAMTYDAMERDFAQIKSLGANLVRFLYPPHPYVLNICDRYGLFALLEIPLVGVPGEVLQTENYTELAASYLREAVLRDRNHVSVLAWGLGDELDFGSVENRCGIVLAMKNMVASLDSRPSYHVTGDINNPCLAGFDFLMVNSFSKDAKEFRSDIGQWKDRYPTKPIIVARYGKDVEPENHNGYSDPLSSESQARFAMQFLDVAKELSLVGSVWWGFSDWRGDRPSMSTHSGDPYLHSFGLLSYERQKRTSFDVIRSVFHGEKTAALPIGSHSSGAPIIFVLAGLIVLIAFAFNYNSNRQFRENVNRSLTRAYNFFADVRDQRILTYGQSFFLAAIIAVTGAIILSSVFTYYRDDRVLDNLLSLLLADSVKERLVRLVWDPVTFIPVVSGCVLVGIFVIGVLVRVFSLVARVRITLYHAISASVWSLLPCVVLIPFAMILYRVMETPMYVVPSLVLIGLVAVWSFIRLLKAVAVISDVFPLKVYLAGVLILAGTVALLYGYLDYTQSTSLYLKHVLGKGGVLSVIQSVL
jgi:hypothetical protein